MIKAGRDPHFKPRESDLRQNGTEHRLLVNPLQLHPMDLTSVSKAVDGRGDPAASLNEGSA